MTGNLFEQNALNPTPQLYANQIGHFSSNKRQCTDERVLTTATAAEMFQSYSADRGIRAKQQPQYMTQQNLMQMAKDLSTASKKPQKEPQCQGFGEAVDYLKQNKTQLREFTNNVHFLPIILVQNPENLTEVQLESVQKQIGAFVSSVKSNK